jgi:hypothetical protein
MQFSSSLFLCLLLFLIIFISYLSHKFFLLIPDFILSPNYFFLISCVAVRLSSLVMSATN